LLTAADPAAATEKRQTRRHIHRDKARVCDVVERWVGRHTYERACLAKTRTLGRGDNLTLTRWLQAPSVAPLDTSRMKLNCYDLLLAGAARAGMASKHELRRLFRDAARAGHRAALAEKRKGSSSWYADYRWDQARRGSMLQRLNVRHSKPYTGQQLQRGDVLVFGNSVHFAMATGRRAPPTSRETDGDATAVAGVYWHLALSIHAVSPEGSGMSFVHLKFWVRPSK